VNRTLNRTRMVIEIELGSTPIGGSLYDCRGEAHSFCGWMNLASVLQGAIQTASASGVNGWQPASRSLDVAEPKGASE
jgi:hypothetical protein